MTRITLQLYPAGYRGWIMPRRVRRWIAGTDFHRAWLLGYLGFFSEGTTRFGPANPFRGSTA